MVTKPTANATLTAALAALAVTVPASLAQAHGNNPGPPEHPGPGISPKPYRPPNQSDDYDGNTETSGGGSGFGLDLGGQHDLGPGLPTSGLDALMNEPSHGEDDAVGSININVNPTDAFGTAAYEMPLPESGIFVPGGPPRSLVPAPGTLALLGVAALAGHRRRRRRRR